MLDTKEMIVSAILETSLKDTFVVCIFEVS